MSSATYDILVTNHIGDALPVTLPPIRVRGVAQYDPAMLSLEGLHKLRGGWAAIVGLTWKHWSAFRRPPRTRSPTAPRPIARLRRHLRAPLRRALARLPGPALDHARAAHGLRLRALAAPDQTGRSNLLDNDRHILTAGVGWDRSLDGVPLHLNAYFQAHLLVHRTHEKDQTLPPSERDPNWLKISSGGSIVVGGLTFGVDL